MNKEKELTKGLLRGDLVTIEDSINIHPINIIDKKFITDHSIINEFDNGSIACYSPKVLELTIRFAYESGKSNAILDVIIANNLRIKNRKLILAVVKDV